MDTHITVQEELLRLWQSFLTGIGCGVFYDILRLLRALIPHAWLAVFLEDALFSFAVCFAFQVGAWSFCGGVLRWQQLLGIALGTALYLLTFGLVTARMLCRLRIFRQKTAHLFRRICGKHGESEKISESP